MHHSLRDQALAHHRRLTPGHKSALSRAGIAPVLRHAHLLGSDQDSITVPIFRDYRTVVGFEYWLPAGDTLVLDPTREHYGLFGLRTLAHERPTVIITEGILESLVLSSQQFVAVSATGSGRVFEPEWAHAFKNSGEVFICFKRSPSSLEAARRAAKLIPNSQVVTLPRAVGTGGGLFAFFHRALYSKQDFLKLLANTSDFPRHE